MEPEVAALTEQGVTSLMERRRPWRRLEGVGSLHFSRDCSTQSMIASPFLNNEKIPLETFRNSERTVIMSLRSQIINLTMTIDAPGWHWATICKLPAVFLLKHIEMHAVLTSASLHWRERLWDGLFNTCEHVLLVSCDTLHPLFWYEHWKSFFLLIIHSFPWDVTP